MGRRLLPLLAAFLFLGLFAPRPLATSAEQAPVYLALGDSLAFGVGASNPSSTGYVARVYQSLKGSERYREGGLELINLSVPGAKSTELLGTGGQLESALTIISERQQDASPAANEVEIVTIDIGGNDLLALVAPGSPCLQSASVEPCRAAFGEVLSAIQTNLTETVRRLRLAAPEAIIVVVDLYNPFSGTGDLREPIAELGVGQANGVIGAVVANADLQAKAASVFQLFSGRGSQWIASDGIHPNDNGHTVIAEAVIAAIAGREPVIPENLLSMSPGATSASLQPNTSTGSNSGGSGVSLFAFVAGIAVAFAAGLVICGGYFIARGRG
jgi:acyl-CoA thioesterase I